MSRDKETNPEVLEQRTLKKRKQGRLRVQRFRERAEERADAKIAQALARITRPNATVATQESSLEDRTATELLRRTCQRNGVNMERIVRTLGEALDAQRVRKVGRKTSLQADFGTRLKVMRTVLADSGVDWRGPISTARGAVDSHHGEYPDDA